jgi:hypothetical protein
VLAVEQTVARSPNVVIRLPTIRAFGQGCMLDVEIVSRQGGLSEDDWSDLHISAHGGFHRGSAPLPRRLLRPGGDMGRPQGNDSRIPRGAPEATTRGAARRAAAVAVAGQQRHARPGRDRLDRL